MLNRHPTQRAVYGDVRDAIPGRLVRLLPLIPRTVLELAFETIVTPAACSHSGSIFSPAL